MRAQPRDRTCWAPLPGSQTAFLSSPFFETLYEGERGPGKTLALVMDFAQDCGVGHGRSWRGVVFRRTFPELADVISKTLEWFPVFFPSAVYNKADHTWAWPDGEELLFRHMHDPRDYWSYHGHGYPFIGFEELCTWPTDECYRVMMSCCRSDNPNVPRKYRSTANPYGVGHNWVKARWRLPHGRFRPFHPTERDEEGNPLPPRVAIQGKYVENFVLRRADPGYRARVLASATNEAQKKAWASGDWDIVAGGMFDDVWSRERNIVLPFPIPRAWRVDRSLDDGASKPFSIGWWAESDGCDLPMPDGTYMSTVRGDLFRFAEWYGAKRDGEGAVVPNVGIELTASAMAHGVVEREVAWGMRSPRDRAGRVRPGPADTSIQASVPGQPSRETDMKKPVRIDGVAYPGVTWTPAVKGPGSRVAGWKVVRQRIRDARPDEGRAVRERPGLFIVEGRCPDFERTMLSLPRLDKNMDDIDTDAEDHVADEVRYKLTSTIRPASSGTRTGHT